MGSMLFEREVGKYADSIRSGGQTYEQLGEMLPAMFEIWAKEGMTIFYGAYGSETKAELTRANARQYAQEMLAAVKEKAAAPSQKPK